MIVDDIVFQCRYGIFVHVVPITSSPSVRIARYNVAVYDILLLGKNNKENVR